MTITLHAEGSALHAAWASGLLTLVHSQHRIAPLQNGAASSALVGETSWEGVCVA